MNTDTRTDLLDSSHRHAQQSYACYYSDPNEALVFVVPGLFSVGMLDTKSGKDGLEAEPVHCNRSVSAMGDELFAALHARLTHAITFINPPPKWASSPCIMQRTSYNIFRHHHTRCSMFQCAITNPNPKSHHYFLPCKICVRWDGPGGMDRLALLLLTTTYVRWL
jgi:hypothetical protein